MILCIFVYLVKMISNEHFKGSINSIILFLLCQKDELYGYEICQMVKQKTSGEIAFTEGAIYPSLHKLEKKRLISSRKERINGRIRKYYTITELGIEENQIQLKSLQNLFTAMSAIFGHKILNTYASR